MKIWLVDDDTDMSELFSDILSDKGHEVQCFSASGTVLQALKKDQPDLLVCDQYLEETTGTELIDQIRQSHSALIVILLTGSQYVFDESLLKHLNIQKVFFKPLQVESFLNYLAEMKI